MSRRERHPEPAHTERNRPSSRNAYLSRQSRGVHANCRHLRLPLFFCCIPRTFRRPGRHRRGAHGLRACGHAETASRAGFSVFAPRAGCHRVRPDHVGGHGIPAGFGPALESTGNRGRDASGPRHLGGKVSGRARHRPAGHPADSSFRYGQDVLLGAPGPLDRAASRRP